MKKGQVAASKADETIDERKAGNQKEEIILTVEHRLPKMLEELDCLGKITLKYNRKAELRPVDQETQKGTLLQTKRMKRYSVKIPSDTKGCDIFSSCFLEDGSVILSDYVNRKLKCLDKDTYSVRDHYDLPWRPWQVCSINRQNVVVCPCDQSEIMFITVGNKMTKQSSMKVEFIYCGLAYAGEKLHISDKNKAVHTYILSGQKLKNLDFKVSGSFGPTGPTYSLGVSKDGSKIYDSANWLIVLDNTGKVVKHFNGQILKYDFDCYVTDRGNDLVCGYRSHNVLQFTADGELIGQVVKSNSCKTVCCNRQMYKMIVGKDLNDIEVYDLI